MVYLNTLSDLVTALSLSLKDLFLTGILNRSKRIPKRISKVLERGLHSVCRNIPSRQLAVWNLRLHNSTVTRQWGDLGILAGVSFCDGTDPASIAWKLASCVAKYMNVMGWKEEEFYY